MTGMGPHPMSHICGQAWRENGQVTHWRVIFIYFSVETVSASKAAEKLFHTLTSLYR